MSLCVWLLNLFITCYLSLLLFSCAEMDAVFDRVCNIAPGREAWRIKVRVLRIWAVPNFINPERTNSLEMVLLDEFVWALHLCFIHV